MSRIPQPIFTLRGHKTGVTALAHCEVSNNPYLISGDELGSIVVWDLGTFKQVVDLSNVIDSRVQSLRVVKLQIGGNEHMVLIIQSRDEGILIIDLSKVILNPTNLSPIIIASYPTFESLFSKGDAVNVDSRTALLAYPSCIENHFVTIRLIGDDAKTRISGTAQRNLDEKQKKSIIFDTKLKHNDQKRYFLFAAYEDGCLCIFDFGLDSTISIPALNTEGLKIDLIKTFDIKVQDFVSAFDTLVSDSNNLTAVCGSPINKLIFLDDQLDSDSEFILDNVELKKQGVSAITIRPDKRLVAVACWDTKIRLYSMKSRKILVTLKYHTKQVQDIIFVEKPELHKYSSNTDISEDLTETKSVGKYLLCCASMEGTISISDIY